MIERFVYFVTMSEGSGVISNQLALNNPFPTLPAAEKVAKNISTDKRVLSPIQIEERPVVALFGKTTKWQSAKNYVPTLISKWFRGSEID